MYMKYLVYIMCSFLLAAILLNNLKLLCLCLSLNLEAQYYTWS